MKKTSAIRLLAIALGTIMVLSVFSSGMSAQSLMGPNITNSDETGVSQSAPTTRPKSYTARDPISITSNSEFTAANGVTGGNGTYSNPYIIEGWDISATVSTAITIENTDAYFIIRNCNVHDGSANNNDGIYFYNLKNGKIENVTTGNNRHGIRLHADAPASASANDNHVTTRADADLYNVNITGNTITSNSGNGIYLHADGYAYAYVDADEASTTAYAYAEADLYNVNITGNTITSNSGNGIYLYAYADAYAGARWACAYARAYAYADADLYNVKITGNTITSNSGNGIYLYAYADTYALTCGADADTDTDAYADAYLYNVNITGNTITSNSGNGIYLYADADADADADGWNNEPAVDAYADADADADLYNVKITGNTITSNSGNGIYLYAYADAYADADDYYADYSYGCADAYAGADLYNVNITGNTITSNSGNGIYLYADGYAGAEADIGASASASYDSSTDANKIYYNNIINNTQNAYDLCTNYWDWGFVGNFWSDYTGTDANDDGIGDTPYDIPGGTNRDNYPLMHPIGYPQANFTHSPKIPTDLDTIQFNDTSTDENGIIILWYWEFGDGSNTTLQNPTHQYADDGAYTVNLTVTDDDGLNDTVSKEITVGNVAPTPNFTYSPLSPTTADTVQFIDTSTDADGTIQVWSWEFGDGNNSTLQNPPHLYSSKGTYQVNLTVTDDDGAEDTYTLSVEVVAPTVTLTSPVGGEIWSRMETIEWYAQYVSGSESYKLQWTNDSGESWHLITTLSAGSTNYSWDTTTVGDGLSYQIKIILYDGDATDTDTSGTFAIENVETIPIVSVIAPNGGECWAGFKDIQWTVSDPDAGQVLVVTIYYSDDAGMSWHELSTVEPTETTYTWNTTKRLDGTNYRIKVSANDSIAVGEDVTDGIFTLDNTPPHNLSVQINAGVEYINTTAATLTLSASDATSGLYQMCFSNNGTTWSDWEAFGTSKQWALTSGDGTKTVYFKVRDNALNEASPVNDTIVLDTLPPQHLSIVINNDAAYTNTTTVSLVLYAVGATEMCFSNGGTEWSNWESYGTLKSWNLDNGDGTKTVYFKVRDVVMNKAVANDSIMLDTTAPTGAVSINDNAVYTNSTSVILTLSATDDGSGIAQMCFSNDGYTWTNWEDYSPSKSWNLTTVDGQKIVYLKVRDNICNVASSVNDTIILDTTPPGVPVISSSTHSDANATYSDNDLSYKDVEK